MPRKVTLSAVQPPLLRRDTIQEAQAAHLEAVTDLLLEAASRSTDLAVLPECVNIMGAPHKEAGSQRAAAETLDGLFTAAIRRIAAAHRMAIVLPIYRIDQRDHLRN